MKDLLEKIQRCAVCAKHLPLGPRPVVQLNASSRIVIISQAPGRRVHESGIPWNDPSGDKLRNWMDVDKSVFYNPRYFSILPMGFCYPGKGASGDMPPRPECAPLWHSLIFSRFNHAPLILLVGQYAQRHYLQRDFRGSLTETVKSHKDFLPKFFPLPHPSPRNQNWLKVNPWFMKETIPRLRAAIRERISMAAATDSGKAHQPAGTRR